MEINTTIIILYFVSSYIFLILFILFTHYLFKDTSCLPMHKKVFFFNYVIQPLIWPLALLFYFSLFLIGILINIYGLLKQKIKQIN